MQQEDIHQYRLSVKRWKAAARHSAGKIQLPVEVKSYYHDSGKSRDYFVAIGILDHLPKRLKSIADLYIRELKNEAVGADLSNDTPPSIPMPPPVSYSKIRSTLKAIQSFQIHIHDAEALHSLRKYCKDVMYIGEDTTLHTHLNLQGADFIRFQKWSKALGDIHDFHTTICFCKGVRKRNHWKQPESNWLIEYLKSRYTMLAIRFALQFNAYHQDKR